MTDRLTPEQIADDWFEDAHECLLAIRRHGYVIVHPDDVFKQEASSDSIDERSWVNGWNGCRRIIFGGDR